MSYKVEVTADSLTELGGKLLALAAQFQTVSAEDTRVPPSPRKKAAPKDEAPKPKHEPEVVGDQPEEPKAEEPKAEEPKEPEIDFNLEVTPLVLRATKELGRERMLAIYEQFGIARASELDPKLLPELIGIIKDGLGE